MVIILDGSLVYGAQMYGKQFFNAVLDYSFRCVQKPLEDQKTCFT